MSLVSQAVAMIGKSRPRKDSDRLKQLSSRLRQIADEETILFDQHESSPSEGDIVLEYDENQYRSDQQMLWVDGVGGYLICLAEEILLGQPNVSSSKLNSVASDKQKDVSEIALLADISSQHLRIRREAGGYLLLPHGPTKINDREIDTPTRLDNGAEIALGDSVLLRFTRPHALSSTALLTVISDHRTEPAADGIVLMAESCVLGPKSHSHLRCPSWESEVILFRSSTGLQCRSSQVPVQKNRGNNDPKVRDKKNSPSAVKSTHDTVYHNGQPAEEPINLLPNSRIEGQDFSLTIEGVIKSKDY